jgi:ferrous iron transport protein B
MTTATCHPAAEGREGRARFGTQTAAGELLVALAGNPNTGKSTVFNALTGLRQHTGNWPGKTVARAEGSFTSHGARFRIVDLPGTYSLHAGSADEEVARDFLIGGGPDVTVVVVDGTRLERNLNLVLQVLEITDRVVVCVNLLDEARRHGITLDLPALERALGVPVAGTSARSGEGLRELIERLHEVATGAVQPRPYRIPDLPPPAERWKLDAKHHDGVSETIFAHAQRIAAAATPQAATVRPALDRRLDRVLTSRWLGFPIMLGMLGVVFWLTVAGANVPSAMLASVLIDTVHPALKGFAAGIGVPLWLSGFLFDGVYLATAWVTSVMLPPMAIFFPLFTLLEDFGYLPRVAFNLDRVFKACGAHGKQALTMCMGFGCNAAGVVATRVIDSPRERLVAIITNNFSLCNGRWPTQILIATIFVGALVPPAFSGLAATAAVVGVAVLGMAFMFGTSWLLTRTLLRGEATTFSLELPPYRPPRVLQTLYTSLIDRTIIVLWRAVKFAAPAGAVIWLVANITVGEGGVSLAQHAVRLLEGPGLLIGLNGVILLAYVVAIPANEIVIPTILMLTVHTTAALSGAGAGAGVMFELDSASAVHGMLTAAGWTMLTGVNLMLFSLLHNPCSTTIYTIYRETGSVRWTTLASLLPVVLGVVVCFLVAQVWRLAGGIGIP